MAIEATLNMAAKCPELKAKAQLPRCTYNPAYILSLGPRLRGCNGSRNNKAGRLPAHDLARSFMQKRPLVSHEIKHSGVRM
ncbi:hypothetical protein PVAP13_3NG179357 [Panicum virgatum]|uniref:Uncharacterized protein n=1 Tax=Panicum virgatum TaxID=38727 RepID=A0A8T0TZA1_PANVG|nr:hypothetical protein PVAP13_3NG179357 [Panicum virgatum]